MSKKKHSDATSIMVKVYSPYKTYFEDEAISISAENDTGLFDILPQHHNFITLVNTCEVIIKQADNKEVKLQIAKGVMHVRQDKITLFLDV